MSSRGRTARGVLVGGVLAMALMPATGSAATSTVVRTNDVVSPAAARGVYLTILTLRGPGVKPNILCYAEANGQTPILTSITRCRLTFSDGASINGLPVTVPGPIAVTGGVSLHPKGPYTACITGKVRYADLTLITDGFCYNSAF